MNKFMNDASISGRGIIRRANRTRARGENAGWPLLSQTRVP